MAQLNFNARDIEPASGQMDPIPAGWYNAAIEESELKPTKAGDNHYLELRFSVLDGQYVNRKVYARLNIHNNNPMAQEIAYKELSAVCHAVGVMDLEDSAQLHNLPMKVRVKLRAASGEYEASNDITAFKNINEQVSQDAPAQDPPQATPTGPQAAPPQAAPPQAPPQAAPPQAAPPQAPPQAAPPQAAPPQGQAWQQGPQAAQVPQAPPQGQASQATANTMGAAPVQTPAQPPTQAPQTTAPQGKPWQNSQPVQQDTPPAQQQAPPAQQQAAPVQTPTQPLAQQAWQQPTEVQADAQIAPQPVAQPIANQAGSSSPVTQITQPAGKAAPWMPQG